MKTFALLALLLASQAQAAEQVTLRLNPKVGTAYVNAISARLLTTIDAKTTNIDLKAYLIQSVTNKTEWSVIMKSYCRSVEVSPGWRMAATQADWPTINSPDVTEYDRFGNILSLSRGGVATKNRVRIVTKDVSLIGMPIYALCSGNTGTKSMHLFKLPVGPLAVSAKWFVNDDANLARIVEPFGIKDFPKQIAFELKSIRTEQGRKLARIAWKLECTKEGVFRDSSGEVLNVEVTATQDGFEDIDVASGLCLAGKYRFTLDVKTGPRQSNGPKIVGMAFVMETKAKEISKPKLADICR